MPTEITRIKIIGEDVVTDLDNILNNDYDLFAHWDEIASVLAQHGLIALRAESEETQRLNPDTEVCIEIEGNFSIQFYRCCWIMGNDDKGWLGYQPNENGEWVFMEED